MSASLMLLVQNFGVMYRQYVRSEEERAVFIPLTSPVFHWNSSWAIYILGVVAQIVIATRFWWFWGAAERCARIRVQFWFSTASKLHPVIVYGFWLWKHCIETLEAAKKTCFWVLPLFDFVDFWRPWVRMRKKATKRRISICSQFKRWSSNVAHG
jgi:hypothetical protein